MKEGKYSLPAETPRKGKSNVPGKRYESKLDTKRDAVSLCVHLSN